ncbi:hypothetical protein NDU88_006109 [Pleurodeles waltl]|uniref:Glutaredoxin-2, mitochondrial n=1 Tax=Pleurodeles waltl TaxID=8319 RepID=A0AAV7TEP0_PLEWA|nr:hypothetical protein NDU88_006109 [Pleurodeles waltl]
MNANAWAVLILNYVVDGETLMWSLVYDEGAVCLGCRDILLISYTLLFCFFSMGNNTSSNRELLDAGAVKLVEEAISHNCVVIFSKTSCPFCTMAKNVFSDLNVAYTVIELDMQENGNQLQAVLHQMTGDRTVPRVFVNGTCIGGGTDTRKLHQQGKLLPLVRQCAASYEH